MIDLLTYMQIFITALDNTTPSGMVSTELFVWALGGMALAIGSMAAFFVFLFKSERTENRRLNELIWQDYKDVIALLTRVSEALAEVKTDPRLKDIKDIADDINAKVNILVERSAKGKPQ